MLRLSSAATCWFLMMTAMWATPTLAAESDESWNQTTATELTNQLSSTLEQIFNDPTVNKQQPSVMQQRKYDGAKGNFELLREDVNILRKQLAEGKGRLYTMPAFKRILSLRKHVRMHAKDTDIAQSIREKATTIDALLEQLKALYNL